jgi:hypothetical protein
MKLNANGGEGVLYIAQDYLLAFDVLAITHNEIWLGLPDINDMF